MEWNSSKLGLEILDPLSLLQHLFYQLWLRSRGPWRWRRHQLEGRRSVCIRRTDIVSLAMAVFKSDSALVEAEEGS